MADERKEMEGTERDALRGWGADWSPDDELRDRTLATLRERGLVGTERRMSPMRRLKWPVMAAAATLAFLLGYAVGWRPSMESSVPVAPVGKTYMLLLYESSAYQAPVGEDGHRARVLEYGNWAREMAMSGKYVDGNELGPEGRWCRPGPSGLEVVAPVTDAARGVLAGYFLIEASSFDEAVRVTSDCPHLRHGGTVEVRKVATSADHESASR